MTLRNSLIRLAHTDPAMRPVLLPLLGKYVMGSFAFKPPKWLVAAVHAGEIETKALLIWKYVVEKQGSQFKFPAAIAYFRNKCRKEGVDLGTYAEKGGGKGPGALAAFPIKNEQIEDWVKQKLASEGLIVDAGKVAAEVELDLSSIEQRIDECKSKIGKHQAGLAAGNRVTQRVKWLASAESELDALTHELQRAKRGLEQVTAAADRHSTAVPTVAFEKAFQKLLKAAMKEMTQTDLMTKVLQGMASFNAELEAAKAQAHAASTHTAGVKDVVIGMLSKAWGKVVGLAARVSGWVKGLFKASQDLSRLMDKAEAA